MNNTKHLRGLFHKEGCGCEHHEEHEHHEHDENCGCGHNHEHHHDEDCGCGHNHEHHHDEDCGCGHNHEHHHHNEDCGCGHHHEHHHHDHEHGCGHNHGGNQVMIGTMQGHLLGTMTAYTRASLPVCEVNMNLSMKDVAMFIKENGGVPMQMKASMKDNHYTVMMNMLGSDIFRSESQESTETDPTRVKCRLLAVADGISQELLREKLEEIMGYFVNNSF